MSKFNWDDILKKTLLLLLFGAIAFVLMTVRSFIFDSDQFFYLQQVEIHGEKYLTHRDIMALSELKVGEKLFDPNLENIKKKISRSPYIKKVEVERRLPSTLIVFIEEENPIAYITNENLSIISETGRILPRAIDFDFPDLPIINFDLQVKAELGDFIKEEPVLDVLYFLRLSKLVSVDLYAIISEISPAAELDVRMINGAAKLLYNYDDLDDQLLNFSYFLDRKENLNFLSKVEYVDIRFKDRIIVKDRKKG